MFDYILVRRIKCFLIRFLIIKKHFINNFCSCFNFIIRKIIFLRNVKIEILLSLLSFFKKSLRLKNSFVVVNLKSLANQVISLISGDKRSKENLPIAGCNRYWIIKNYSVVLFLNFQNICTRNLKLGLTKKYVWWIESGMEK